MKKMIAVLIAVMMLATTAFAGVAMAAGEEDLTGTWYLHSMKQGGQEIDASVLSSMGMNMTLTLNEDGSATMEMTGQEEIQEGTWTADGNSGVLAFGNNLDFTLEDELIYVQQPAETVEEGQEAQVMVFGREAGEVDLTLAPAVEDPQLSDFNGDWNCTTEVTFGIPLPMYLMSSELTMTIEDGKAAVSAASSDLNSGEITDATEGEFDAELTEDGTLYIDLGDSGILELLQMTGSTIVLTLREDDTMTGEIPEMTESLKVLSEMSAESENTEAEEAETAEAAEGEGDSGDSDSSGGTGMDIYLVFEKAE